jgi:hypothetical protein
MGHSSIVGTRTKLCMAGARRFAPADGPDPPPDAGAGVAAGGEFWERPPNQPPKSEPPTILCNKPASPALAKVCIGGGDAAGRLAVRATFGAAAGATAVGGFEPLGSLMAAPCWSLLSAMFGAIQFVDGRLFVAECPPALSYHLHGWRGRNLAASRVSPPGQAQALRRAAWLRCFGLGHGRRPSQRGPIYSVRRSRRPEKPPSAPNRGPLIRQSSAEAPGAY